MIRRFGFVVILCATVIITLVGLCFFGIWIPNEPSRQRYPIRGIDVSHHQRDIDWAAVKASGISFAYIKATEGADFKDSKFSENWNNSNAAQIVRGAYHFFTFGTSGESQAANFIAAVSSDANMLPPAIDLEFSGYNETRRPSRKEFAHELSVFWDAVIRYY